MSHVAGGAEARVHSELSQDADATSLPSGENATPHTESEWPSSVRRAAPVAESQNRTVWSRDADPTSLPSGENATPDTPPEWPSSARRAAPVPPAHDPTGATQA